MGKVTRYFIAVLCLLAVISLSGCERALSGHERDNVLAYADAAVEELLAGLKAGDYDLFSRSFDFDQQEETPAASFETLKQELDGELGDYLSRTVEQVTQADEFWVVDYQARFEQAEAVKITVALHAVDQSIAGFSIDSEKGSWSTFR